MAKADKQGIQGGVCILCESSERFGSLPVARLIDKEGWAFGWHQACEACEDG